MKTKNITPFPFGARVTSRKPPQLEMSLVVRGVFSLRPNEPVAPRTEVTVSTGFPQGFLTGDVFHEDDEERRRELLYASDFADFKLRADLLLKGTCHPAGGRMATETLVEFAVGSWSKRLRVIGRRVWTEAVVGSPVSAPAPFAFMPLGYENAFGGPEYALNPAGKGFNTQELPTVELVDSPVRGRNDKLLPAGFGPLSPSWPQRAGKVGTEYGKAYQAERAPFYAEDFDWTYFNAAPPDQQLAEYLRGDEELRFTNLHPAASVFHARLPGIRVRVFVKDVEGRFREVRMNLDTLLADLDDEVLTLTWRGLDKVKDPDLKDVAFAFVASEPLAERPLPVEYYQQLLTEFERDPLGFKDVPGIGDVSALFEKNAKGATPDPLDPSLDPVSAALKQKLGPVAPGVQSQVQKSMASAGAAGDALAKAQPGADLNARLASAIQASAASSSAFAIPRAPGAMPRVPLKDAIQRMVAAGEKIKKLAAEKGLSMPALAKIDAIVSDPKLLALDPSLKQPKAPEGEPLEEPGPGRDLKGRDFSRRDLSGMDLRGADLEGANFTGANLRGANLAGANLKYAVLFEAVLDDASLARADLSMANVSKASALRANLSGAKLDQAYFLGANLGGAHLEGARGEQTILSEVNLEEAKAEGASFYQADFEGAVLTHADFTEASLVRCLMAKVEGSRVVMIRATLTLTSFAEAQLDQARFSQAKGETTIWTGARLDRADFSYAVLPLAHFTEVSAPRASFFAADLKEARFYRATLDHAELVQCNLFSADLSRAVMNGTKFTGSNLYDAKFLNAGGVGCDFTDANLKASTLERT